MKFRKVKGDHYEADYQSDDGRFVIEKRQITAARNGYWKAGWRLIDTKTGKRFDEVRDATKSS